MYESEIEKKILNAVDEPAHIENHHHQHHKPSAAKTQNNIKTKHETGSDVISFNIKYYISSPPAQYSPSN